LGDLIEGGDESPEQLKQQWDTFDQRAVRTRTPEFYVGGNMVTISVLRGVVNDDPHNVGNGEIKTSIIHPG